MAWKIAVEYDLREAQDREVFHRRERHDELRKERYTTRYFNWCSSFLPPVGVHFYGRQWRLDERDWRLRGLYAPGGNSTNINLRLQGPGRAGRAAL